MLVITVVLLFASILTTLGQRATQGHQIGDTSTGFDVILPVSIAQCDNVPIYYNTTNTQAFHSDTNNLVWLFFYTPWDGDFFFEVPLNYGVTGYLDWICNIPAGNAFIVKLSSGGGPGQYYTVQPGSSSCLGPVTIAYPSAFYESTFQSYTQNSFPLASYYAANTLYHLPTIAFPTSSYPTITVNPMVDIPSITASTSPSSALPSIPSTSPSSARPSIPSTSPSSALPSIPSTSSSSALPSPQVSSSHKTDTSVIVGGVVGGIIGGLALAFLAYTLVGLLQRRRKPHVEEALQPSVTPFLAESKSKLYAASSENVGRGSQSMSNIGPTVSQHNLTPYPSETAGRNSPSALSTNVTSVTSDLDSAQDSTRLHPTKRPIHVSNSSSSGNLASETSPPPPPPTSQARTSTHSHLSTNETQGGLTTVLDVVSRAQLSSRERHALAANLLIPDQLGAGSPTTENTPPPYSG